MCQIEQFGIRNVSARTEVLTHRCLSQSARICRTGCISIRSYTCGGCLYPTVPGGSYMDLEIFKARSLGNFMKPEALFSVYDKGYRLYGRSYRARLNWNALSRITSPVKESTSHDIFNSQELFNNHNSR